MANREEKVAAGALPPDFPLPYMTWAELQDELSTRQTLHLGQNYAAPGDGAPSLGDLFTPGQRYGGQLRTVLDDLYMLRAPDRPIVVVTQQAQRLAELWGEQESYIHPVTTIARPEDAGTLAFVEGALAEGWVLHGEAAELHLLTDAGSSAGSGRTTPPCPASRLPRNHFADLQVGISWCVEYGIGRFAGLRRRQIDQTDANAGDRVRGQRPVRADPQADLSRYVGGGPPAAVHRLGTQDWSTPRPTHRPRCRRSTRASGIVRRPRRCRAAFSPDTPWQAELERRSLHETIDQIHALDG